MTKHLFLEGPIQEGKSTLIRKMICRNLSELGGFSSQRLLDESGKTVGFRIAPASEAMELTRRYSPELSEVFLHFDGKSTKAKPEIFTETAIRYLRQSRKKKLILLDEIGGIELLAPKFREELYGILSGGIPCIGVLKLETSNRNMCSNGNIDRECTDYHLQLRDFLVNRFGADLIHYNRQDSLKTEKVIQTFLAPFLK